MNIINNTKAMLHIKVAYCWYYSDFESGLMESAHREKLGYLSTDEQGFGTMNNIAINKCLSRKHKQITQILIICCCNENNWKT